MGYMTKDMVEEIVYDGISIEEIYNYGLDLEGQLAEDRAWTLTKP